MEVDKNDVTPSVIRPNSTTRWYRLPTAVRAIAVAAMAFGVTWFAYRMIDPDSPSAAPFITAGSVALAMALFALAEERGLRRDFGSVEQYIGYRTALRTGELPSDVKPATWRRWLNLSRKKQAQIPVTALAIFVIGLVLVDHPLAAATYASVALVLVIDWRIKERRVAHLSMELEERASEIAAI